MSRKNDFERFGEPTTISVRSVPYLRMKQILSLQPHLSLCRVVSELMEEWCEKNEKKFGHLTMKELLERRRA